MPRPISTRVAVAALVVASLLATSRPSFACPFCEAPSRTLSELVDESDVVLVAEWAGGRQRQGNVPGETDYKVVRVIENGTRTFQKGDTVTIVRFREGEKGELVLLTGIEQRGLEWDPPMPVDETLLRYVEQAPKPDRPTVERLEYFLGFLEFPNQEVSNDAYAEFANSPYDEIVKLRAKFPRERLRKWIQSDATPPTRLGLYGLLLGLCGTAEDARAMQAMVLEPTTEFRLGIEGVMAGYVLLTGERGLRVIEETKFKAKLLTDADGNPILDADGDPEPVPFSETYAGLQTLRFLQEYESGVIPQERLNQSMRLLIDRAELADIVIADLARWKDWSNIGRIVKLYGTKGYDSGAVKRAVLRYLLAAERAPGPQAARATAAIAYLAKRDPKFVPEAIEFIRNYE